MARHVTEKIEKKTSSWGEIKKKGKEDIFKLRKEAQYWSMTCSLIPYLSASDFNNANVFYFHTAETLYQYMSICDTKNIQRCGYASSFLHVFAV